MKSMYRLSLLTLIIVQLVPGIVAQTEAPSKLTRAKVIAAKTTAITAATIAVAAASTALCSLGVSPYIYSKYGSLAEFPFFIGLAAGGISLTTALIAFKSHKLGKRLATTNNNEETSKKQ